MSTQIEEIGMEHKTVKEFEFIDDKWIKREGELLNIILTKEEVVSIKLVNELISSAAKDIEIDILKLQQLETLKAQLISKKDNDSNRFDQLKKEGMIFLESIHEKYGIPIGKKWGYNPETREVVFT